MARPIWKGFISFGLVSIPVGLYSAIESREELSFHLLHKKDLSRVDYKRYCEKEGVEVPWKEIVKGYEYRKGSFQQGATPMNAPTIAPYARWASMVTIGVLLP